MKCWCGIKHAHFDERFLDKTCDGSRVLYCHCGGDMCICHNHGEVECLGCEDCDPEIADDDYSAEDYNPNED